MPTKRKPKLEERRCPQCLRWFRPSTGKQIYHSEACRAAAYRERKAERDDEANDRAIDAMIEMSLDPDLLEA